MNFAFRFIKDPKNITKVKKSYPYLEKLPLITYVILNHSHIEIDYTLFGDRID